VFAPGVVPVAHDPVVSELLNAAGPASKGAVAPGMTVDPVGAAPTTLALLPVRPEAPIPAPDPTVPELVVPEPSVPVPVVPVPIVPVPRVPVPSVPPKPVVPVPNVPPRPVVPVPNVPPRPMVPVPSEPDVPAAAPPAWPAPPAPRATAIEDAPRSKAAAKGKIFKAFMSGSTSLVCMRTNDVIGVCGTNGTSLVRMGINSPWNGAFRESALKCVNMRR
jgi:hypothetical protein